MTYYLLLALALGVAGLGCALHRRFPGTAQVLIIGGCVGSLACVGWQVRETLFSPAGKGPDRGQAVVAYYLANQVLGEVADREGDLVLLFPPANAIDEEAVGTYAGTFSRVLRGFPGLKVRLLTLSVPGKAAKSGQISLGAFTQALSNTAPALAYVSFAGVPADIGKFRPGTQPGAFFVFDPWGTTNWLGALKTGQVRVAIVPRPGTRQRADADVAGEPREVFERLYLMATTATAESVLGQLRQK